MHRPEVFRIGCAAILALALVSPRNAAADWPAEPNVNVPLCTATGNQSNPTVIPDGVGGIIATWEDSRGGYATDIYAQRISATGALLWTADGVAVCTATNVQDSPSIVSDGAGGAIVAWRDNRGGGTYDIYAQRISATGTPLWTADGVALCTAGDYQGSPRIVSDGAHGAIVAWEDDRGGNADIYAQAISATGEVRWAADGVALCIDPFSQASPAIESDRAGGAVVAWVDRRNGSTLADIYAQRVTSGGTPFWTGNGVKVCDAEGLQVDPVIASNATGDAIVAWYDWRSGTSTDIYAQRISAAGNVSWDSNGVALSIAARNQAVHSIASDGTGGAIVTWQDERSGTSVDIYAQRVSAAGGALWTTDGVALCMLAGDQYRPKIAADGAGGATVTWEDYRNNAGDIYAQRVSANGEIQWTAGGVAVCALASSQQYPTIASDGAGGAVVAWEDHRNGQGADVYAQRIWANGSTPVRLSFVEAEVGADAVTLTWYAGGGGCAVATVYRSTGGGEWTRIGETTADGTGYLRYTDPVGGMTTRVGYRLGIVDAGVEGLFGETWVDLTASQGEPSLALALDPVHPNPSRGSALTVRFTLPGAAAASLELLDVSGRRIAAREVGSFGAGRHALDLGEGARLAPGLYLVRLTQGGSVRATRVAVLK